MTSPIFPLHDGASPAPAARRDFIASERRRIATPPRTSAQRKTTAVTKSSAKIATVPSIFGLPFAGYTPPAYAAKPPAATSPFSGAGHEVPSIHMARTDTATNRAFARDALSVVVKPKIASNPYVRVSDEFANNPNNLDIQWSFSQGVPISSGFGPRSAPCGGCSSFYEGLDLTPGVGTPIQAIADGKVSEVGNPSGSFGLYAVIDGQRVSSLFGHMQRGSLNGQAGKRIKKRGIVGSLGSTGARTGRYLHIRILLGGEIPIDPFAYLESKVGA